jgi:hypothetical protein
MTLSLALDIRNYGSCRNSNRNIQLPVIFGHQRYFNTTKVKDGTNPLLYSKTHQFNFPILAAMAKDYFTVQASPSPRKEHSRLELILQLPLGVAWVRKLLKWLSV